MNQFDISKYTMKTFPLQPDFQLKHNAGKHARGGQLAIQSMESNPILPITSVDYHHSAQI